MPSYLIAIGKINLVLTVFVVIYYVGFRRLTHYTINRFFLQFSIVFSFAYPFVDLSWLFEGRNSNVVVTNVVPELTQPLRRIVEADTTSVYAPYLSAIFLVGMALLLGRFIFQGRALYRIHKSSQPAYIDQWPVQLIGEKVSAFSFWRKIYLNPSLHTPESIKTIVAHERVHTKQWHTLDILLVETGMLLYWFNPLAWLLRKAVKENLEFIADREVLQNGADRETYQHALLNATVANASLEFSSQFNFVDLKRRILMMNKKRSSRFTLYGYFLLLPSLVGLCLLLTVSVKGYVKNLVEKIQIASPAAHQLEVTSQPTIVINTQNKPERSSQRMVRPLIAQPLSQGLIGHVSEQPSTNNLHPGKPLIEIPGERTNTEIVVTGYKGPKKKTVAANSNPPLKIVNGIPIPSEITIQGYKIRRVQGFRTNQNPDTLNTSEIKVVRGYQAPQP